jgi:hypothetical protein
VDRPNTVQCGLAFDLVAERQRQHGFDGVTQAAERSHRAAAKRAVVGHTRGNQRMRELQKDCPQPCNQQQTLGVEVVPVAEQPKEGPVGKMEVVDVSAESQIPLTVLEERAKEAAQNEPQVPTVKPLSVEESEEHRKFLDDLDQRIAQLSTRNNERDQDETYKRMAEAPADGTQQDVPAEQSQESPQPEQAPEPPKSVARLKI